MRLDHLVVWTRDLEATATFLTEVVGWRRLLLDFGVSASESTTGGMKLALIDANGLWLELVQPTSPGPGALILEQKGDGAFVELAFEPADYDGALSAMRARGIQMLNMDGTPIRADGGAIRQGSADPGPESPAGIRIAYWPRALSFGTQVEMYEFRADVASDAFTIRKRVSEGWSPNRSAPRVDRIAIIVADIERSARFYTRTLGLGRQTRDFALDGDCNARSGGMRVRFIDAGAVALALVQPVGPGPLMDCLIEKGDGHIAELIVEVDDLAAYHDRMKARGVQMVDTGGEPVDPVAKAQVLQPFGDRIAYFPTDASRGMVIEVSERGSRGTSLIHTRDANWEDALAGELERAEVRS